MTELTVLHNSRCSKSRQAVALLKSKGVDFTVVDYLKSPPSITVLRHIVKLLGSHPTSILRKSEPLYQELGVASQAYSDEQWYQLMHEHPILIERPIVYSNTVARICRPPELVLEVLA